MHVVLKDLAEGNLPLTQSQQSQENQEQLKRLKETTVLIELSVLYALLKSAVQI